MIIRMHCVALLLTLAAFASIGPAAARSLNEINSDITTLESQEFDDQATLDYLKEISTKLAGSNFVIVQTPYGMRPVPKVSLSKWIAAQILSGAMTQEQGRALAANIGRRNRAMRTVLAQEIASTEAHLDQIKDRLSAVLDERGRLNDISGNARPPQVAGGRPDWRGQWVNRGVGDCYATDVATVLDTSVPDTARCSPEMEGKVVVCWDGATYKNWGKSRPQCTYKDKSPSTCKGNPSPGIIYECVRQ